MDNNIRVSDLMHQLFAAAIGIGGKNTEAPSAEQLLVAAIDLVLEGGSTEDEELQYLHIVLSRYVGELVPMKEALLVHIAADDTTEEAAADYLNRRVQEVGRQARRRVDGCIRVPDLVRQIMRKPTQAIATAKMEAAVLPPVEFDDPVYCEEDGGFFDPEESATYARCAINDLVEETQKIREKLTEVVFGQDHAIDTFVSGYFQARMLERTNMHRHRPKAVFLFAGPPGVGKTFLAETVAEALGLAYQRFDMSEYADKEANIEFCGSDKVYKNGKPGNITSFVEAHPKCVLLFDEIEKAHAVAIHLFLQMLDAGRLRDNYTDNEVSFSDAIIILTTNAGKQLYEEYQGDELSSVSRKVVIRALQKDINPTTGNPFFPMALCSRFASGNVVMFNHMTAHNLMAIARKEMDHHALALQEDTGIHLEMDDRVCAALLYAEGITADARTVRARAERFFNDELYELLRMITSPEVGANIHQLERIHMAVDLSGAAANIQALFYPSEPMKLLIFAPEETVEYCRRKLPQQEIYGAQTPEAAIECLKNTDITAVLLDIGLGAAAKKRSPLNIVDVDSPARSFYQFLREQKKDIPVYLLEQGKTRVTEAEAVTFRSQGVREVLRLDRRFARRVQEIAEELHHQAGMEVLARQNKLLSFETAQSLSKHGDKAQIRLFDFSLAVAVDSEDTKSVLGSVSRPNIRFSQVIGAAEAKRELTYFVEYLKNPKKYLGTGVKAPKGVLLYGPPGTGKTLLAKAMAGESEVTFLAAEGNLFVKSRIGEGAEKVHELFRTARKYAPSILFIDEIDAVGKTRGSITGNSSDDALTAFLTEMDGFISEPGRPVFVLAATNFDVDGDGSRRLDPALLRRFDRRVLVDLPDREDRTVFLQRRLAENPTLEISRDVVENIAVRATGMSLAELDSVVELALRSAIRQGSTRVTNAIFEEAFETFNSGEAKQWDASLLERVARHEAGHALLSWLGGQTPAYLTIVARGSHGGYTQRPEQEGKALFTRQELLDNIRTALGGRAAEIVCYGEGDGISTGAAGDLVAATAQAMRMVMNYGMEERLGMAVITGEPDEQVRSTVNRILSEQLEEGICQLRRNREKLDVLVEVLLVKNHITGTEIDTLLGANRDK